MMKVNPGQMDVRGGGGGGGGGSSRQRPSQRAADRRGGSRTGRNSSRQSGTTATMDLLGRADSRGSARSRGSQQLDLFGDAGSEGAFTSQPIVPAGGRTTQAGTTGGQLAQPHELADYTKRKVAEIMARERETQRRVGNMKATGSQFSDSEDEVRPGSATSGSSRTRSYRNRKEESSESEDSEEDADDLFMSELKKEKLKPHTKFLLCFGFVGLMALFLAIFASLAIVTVNQECSEPWFAMKYDYSYPAKPICGTEKRCGNIGGVFCKETEVTCPLEKIEMDHFKGTIEMIIHPLPSATNISLQLTHRAATRKGVDGMHTEVTSKDKTLRMFMADYEMRRDTATDYYIDCRRADVKMLIPKSLSGYPSINVSTHYGKVVLPAATDFDFTSVRLATVQSDLIYGNVKPRCPVKTEAQLAEQAALGLFPCVAEIALTSEQGNVDLQGAEANMVTLKTSAGSIYSSGIRLSNKTIPSLVSLTLFGSDYGVLNATSSSGNVEVSVLGTGVVSIASTSGDIKVSLQRSFAGSYVVTQGKSGGGLSVSDVACTSCHTEDKREKMLLSGTIGGGGGASIKASTDTGKITLVIRE